MLSCLLPNMLGVVPRQVEGTSKRVYVKSRRTRVVEGRKSKGEGFNRKIKRQEDSAVFPLVLFVEPCIAPVGGCWALSPHSLVG